MEAVKQGTPVLAVRAALKWPLAVLRARSAAMLNPDLARGSNTHVVLASFKRVLFSDPPEGPVLSGSKGLPGPVRAGRAPAEGSPPEGR